MSCAKDKSESIQNICGESDSRKDSAQSQLGSICFTTQAQEDALKVASYAYKLTEYPYINYNKRRKWCWIVGFGEIIIASSVFYSTLMLVLAEPPGVQPLFPHYRPPTRNALTTLSLVMGIIIMVLAVVQCLLGMILLIGLFRWNPEATLTHCHIWLWGSYFQVTYVVILLSTKFCPGLEDICSFGFFLLLFRILGHLKVRRFAKDIRQYFEERRMVMDIERQIMMQTGQDPREFSTKLIDTMPHLKRPEVVEEEKPKRNPAAEGTLMDGLFPYLIL